MNKHVALSGPSKSRRRVEVASHTAKILNRMTKIAPTVTLLSVQCYLYRALSLSLSLSPPALSGVGLPSSATNFSHPMHFVGSTQRNLFPIFLQLDPNPT